MKEEILAKEEQLRQAMLKADLPQLDNLLHDKLLFHIPGGILISKEMDLENYRNGRMRVQKLNFKKQKIELHEEVAVISTEVEMEGIFGGNPFSDALAFLRVWKKSEGEWKVIAGGSSRLSS